MPTQQELPEQFGRYRILKKLGAGGMGSVYLAEDSKLRRKVALKVPHLTGDGGDIVLERFQHEARLAAGIDHSNFCAVYDVDEINGVHFFTMAYIEGTPLSDRIRNGQPWPEGQAVELVRRVALAVEVLHQKGIIHRDLKPANVMVRTSGEPVLMDFGLARSLTTQSHRPTASGQVVGTPGYMPPEQAEGARERIGPASDVYSLGMILYQLLTGQLAFDADNIFAMLHQIIHKPPPPPSSVRPGLDARLDAISLKALAKKPEERFVSISALVAALDGFLASSPGGLSSGTMEVAPPTRTCEAAGRQETLLGTTLNTTAKLAPTSTGWRRLFRSRSRLLSLLAVVLLGIGIWIAVKLFNKPTHPPDNSDISKTFTNTLEMKMVLIPAGEFTMGSSEGDKDRSDNEVVQHRVRITQPFYMGATEVTNAQFRQFMEEEKDYKTDAEKAGDTSTWKKNDLSTAENQPVVYVSHNDAVAFCKWLSEKEKKTYDLPTDAEWEYACRAGEEGAFCFGEDSDKLGEYAWFEGNSERRTHAVGTKKANPWGLFDMHGNVHEWCKDSKRNYPTKEEAEQLTDPIEDPEGPENGGSRVVRGGSWADGPRAGCRSACRVVDVPDDRLNNIGFRVLMRPR